MFDIELLRGFYKGSGVKIALIDTGMCEISANSKNNVSHYAYNDDTCIIESIENPVIISNHGSICGKYIAEIAPDAEIIDINVENSDGDILEVAVCSAIKFAVKLHCDIINISLGFFSYSEELFDVCRYAYNKGVVVVSSASHTNTIIFPADFDDYAIKVLCSDAENNEKIVKVGKKTYQATIKPYTHEHSTISGTSIACAYFSAILALYIESRPIFKRSDIIEELFKSEEKSKKYSKNNSGKKVLEFEKNSIISVISKFYDYLSYKDIMNKNIVGYYDSNRKTVNYFNESVDSQNLYVVNPLKFDRIALPATKFKHNYIGNFENIDSFKGIKLSNDDLKLHNINVPIILIAGVGTECSKFSVQLELKQQMFLEDVKHHFITYNPLGTIFDMDYLMYPENEPFKNIIYSINEYVSKLDLNDDYDCIVINVGGGMFPLNRNYNNDFGMLYNAYLNALPIDYMVLCTNSVIETRVIRNEIMKLNLIQKPDIAIVVSDLTYNSFTTPNSERSYPYVQSPELFKLAYETYTTDFPEYPVYTLSDVENKLLYNDILSKMT